MGKSTCEVAKYAYRIKIDVQRVIDQIIDNLPGDVKDVSFEEDVITISGNHWVKCRCWTSPQTLESPAENEIELEYSIEDIDIKRTVKEAMKQWKVTVEMDEPEIVERY